MTEVEIGQSGPELDPESDLVESGPTLPPPPEDAPRAARRLPRQAWLLTGLAGLLTLATRLPGLDRPRIQVFDEVFYATQGLEVGQTGVEQGYTVHPPMAKWMIGAGIRAFGFNSFGWRIVPLLAGVLVVMATVVAAYRLLESLALAGFAGLVVLTDGIAFTSGRLALLDGILAAFTTVAFAAVATAVARPLDVPLRRRVTWVVGVSLGAALACKWSAAAPMLVAALVLGVVAWRSTPRGRRRRELLRVAACVVALPIGVYGLTYIPTMVNFGDSAIGRDLCDRTGDCHASITAKIGAIFRDHRKMLDFHRHLVPKNKYAHSAIDWVFQTEPVGLLKSHCPSADPVCSPGEATSVRRIIGVGNPIIWALATLALLVLVVLALWRLHLATGLVVAWAAALWIPWIVVPRFALFPFEQARPGYTFYAAPLVPLLGIALAMAVRELRGRWRPAVGGVLVAVMVLGALALYPVWTARPTAASYLHDLVDG